MENENENLIRFLRNLSLSRRPTPNSPRSPISEASLLTCSYPLGYTEQNIYTCKTCEILSGICLGCCYNCHEGHEIIDIGPKKEFRCDCGVGKNVCKLFSDKEDNQNRYCHNFVGRFCVCDAVDCEVSRESDMHLCVGCYDWFHESCIQIYNNCHNFAGKNFHQKNFPVVPEDLQEYFLLCEKCVNQKIFMANKFRNFFSLERTENWVPVEKYPYFVFVRKDWFRNRCECSECCSLEMPKVAFQSFQDVPKRFDEEIEDIGDVVMSGSHEEQIYIAQGICVLRELLQQSLRESFRSNFRSEVEELRKRMIEQRRRFI